MRLLQADILFIALDQHWKMPRYGGKLLLGLGERDSNRSQSIDAAKRIYSALQKEKWRSWVLTDADAQPTFGVVNGALTIRLSPYYYFWNVDEKEVASRLEAHNRLVAQHNALAATVRSNVD